MKRRMRGLDEGKKRLLSGIMSFLLVFTMIPTPALAELIDETSGQDESTGIVVPEGSQIIENDDGSVTIMPADDDSADLDAVSDGQSDDQGDGTVADDQGDGQSEIPVVVEEAAAGDEEDEGEPEAAPAAAPLLGAPAPSGDDGEGDDADGEPTRGISDTDVAKIGDQGYATLQAAIEAAQSGDTIVLLEDVDLTGATYTNMRIPISKSLTIDGGNHTITVANRGFGVGMEAESKVDVTFKNVTINNTSEGARCIDTRGNLNSLTLENVKLDTTRGTGYVQPLTIGGNQADAATITINDSTIQTNDEGTQYYAIITFNPVNMTIDRSTIKGWACIYAKGSDNSCSGSAGSTFTITNSTLVSKNPYSGATNAFAMFVAEDDNVTFDVTGSELNVTSTGDQYQTVASLGSTNSVVTLGSGNTVNLTGANSYVGYDNQGVVATGGRFTGDNAKDALSFAEKGMVLDSNGNLVEGTLDVTLSATKATYDGTNHMPEITSVKLGDKKLEADEYKAVWSPEGDQVAAGTYTLTVTYGVATGTATFTVNPMRAAVDASVEEQTYTGSAITPAITFTDDDGNTVSLTEGKDYTVEWTDNTNVGTAKASITFIGNYKGSTFADFAIKPASLDAVVVSEISDQFSTGSAIEPKVTLTLGGYTLVEGTDYEIAYSNNTNAGQATITITGKGNFTGTKTINFNIVNAVATIGENKYATLEEAVAAANAMTGDVTIELHENVTWTTGASHGSTPLLTADSAVSTLTINGNGNTLTAVGQGIGSLRAANGGMLVFNGMTIKDESVSYAESSWEHGYLEFAGNLTFNDVDFVNAVMLTRDNGQAKNCDATFTNCSFNSNKANEYDVWVATGKATFNQCSFTGYRGAKTAEKYSYDEVDTIAFNQCEFKDLTVKPGLAVGPVNADTTIIFDTCTFENVQAGDQGLYVLESDQDVTTYELIIKGTAMVDNVDAVVARIGDRGFLTVDSAFATVKPGETLEILKAGTYTLPNLPQNITVKGDVDGVVFNCVGAEKTSICSIPNGATFENVTFYFGNVNYHGFQHAGTINMVGCTLNGKLFSYGDMNFTGCTFNAPGTADSGVSGSDYSMWAYAGNITYTDCAFNGAGKFLNVYNESGATRYTVAATDCEFNNTGAANKAAINVKETCGSNVLKYTVNINGCTTTGSFPEASESDALTVISGLVQVDDRVAGGTMDGGEITVNVDGEQAYITPAIARVAAIGDEQYVSLQAALDAAHEMTGDVTITLLADIEGYSIVRQKTDLNLTIDGNGKTLAGQIIIDGDGRANGTETLTIQNVKFEDDKTNFLAGTDAFILVPSTKDTNKPYSTGKYNYAHNITVSDCSFTSTSSALDVVGYKATSGATQYNMTLQNVTGTNLHSLAQLTATEGATITGCTVTNTKNGINISGGGGAATISDNTLDVQGYTVRLKDGSSMAVTLADNTFSGSEGLISSATGGGKITINSGNYAGPLPTDGSKLTINGGLFSVAPVISVCADGKYPMASDNATYPYTVGEAVALVDGLGYATFEEAVTAAEGTKTITLLADIADPYTLEVGKTLKVALNGKNLTVEAPEGSVLKSEATDGVTTYTVAAAVAKIGDTLYASLADAIAAVPADGTPTTITVLADHNIDVTGYALTVQAGKNVVLDLNGKTVTGVCSDASTSALIRNLGTLTINDSVGNGKLIGGADATWTWDGSDDYSGSYASNLIRNEGTLIVNGGTLYNASAGSAAYAIDNYSAGKVTINGGTIDAKKASAIRMFYNNGGSIVVNDGTIGHYNSDDDCTYMGIQVMAGTNADVTVNGGTIAGMYALYSSGTGDSSIAITGGTLDGYVGIGSTASDDISITGGQFTAWVGTWGDHTGFISGGLFAEAPDAEYCADGVYPIANTDDATKADFPYTVGAAVATVDDFGYVTFAEAVEAAGGTKTITLLDNIADPYTLGLGETLKVALNGKTLTVKAPEGYVLKTETTDGVTTYSIANAVCSITKDGETTVYASLEDAFAAAQSGDTIDVFAGEVELPATAVIPAGVTIKGAENNATTLKITTSNGDGVKLTNPNITIQDVNIDGSAITNGGYNSLINVEADGCVIDNVVFSGGGRSTWNSSILVEKLTADQTFTVKNSTITGSFRGVLRESCSANIVIENCEIDAVYPFNIDGGNGGKVTVTDSKIHGWTSYSGVEKVTFTNCEFSKGNSGYDVVAAYVDTEFNNCSFDSELMIYAQTSPFDFTFTNCMEAGKAVTRENFTEKFPEDSDVWTKCNTYVDGKLVGAVASITVGDETTEYKTLQAAIDAAHEMTGDVTVTLVADITEVAIVHQKAGFNLTIDGNGKTITGQLYVDGDGRYNEADTLTIQNVNFAYDAATYDDAFIDFPSTKTAGKLYTTGKYNYAHNVTITGCTFNGEGTTTVAVRVASGAGAHNLIITNNTVTAGHSFAQLVGVKDLTVTDNTATGVKNGINISGGDGTGTISGNTIAAQGYSVRMKDACGMATTLSDNTFSASEGLVNEATGGAKFTIESGKYAGPLPTDASKLTINGGVFDEPPAIAVCGEGVYPIANTDDATKADYPYTVGAAVALVDGFGYGTFDEAVEAAGGTKTIKLLANYDGTYTMASGQTLIVEKNGFTFKAPVVEGAYVVKSTTSSGVTTYTVVEADLEYTNAAGVTSYKVWSNTVISGSGTYKLLGDITATARIAPGILGSDITLDLNGHTLTSTASDCAVLLSRDGSASSHKTFSIVDTSENKDGTLKVSTAANHAIQLSGKYNDVTIGEGVTIDGGCVSVLSENQTLTVNGTINGGNDFAIATNGSTTKNTTITVGNGAVLTSDITAMYLPGNEGVAATVEGNASITGITGIEIRGGSLTVSDNAVITAIGEFSEVAYDNGTTIKGAAVAVSQHTTNLPINVSITGGTLTGAKALYEVDLQDETTEGVTISVTNGKFAGEIGSENCDGFISGGLFTVAPAQEMCAEGLSPIASGNAEYPYTVGTAVASITSGGATAYYGSLSDAVTAAANGDTITMIANSVEPNYIEITKSVTIDLDGHTVSRVGNALLNPMGSDVTLTVKDSVGTGKVTSNVPVWVESGASFVLESGTIESGSASGIAVYSDRGTAVTINGGTVLATGNKGDAINATNTQVTINNGTVKTTGDSAYTIAVFGTSTLVVNDGSIIASGADSVAIGDNGNAGNNVSMTINGGTITSASDIAIYKPAAGSLTINGGTITGATAIYQKSGTLSIPAESTATITANGAKVENTHSGNGAVATGDAIVIESCDYPGGAPSATIAGGTITSASAAAVSEVVFEEAATPSIKLSGGTYVTGEDPAETVADAIYPLAMYTVEVTPGTYKIQPSLESLDIEVQFATATGSAPRHYTYTGEEIEPVTGVKVVKDAKQPISAKHITDITGGAMLDADDYTVTYERNKNAGTATVTITGKEGSLFAGTSTTREFEIEHASLANAVITGIAQTYTGNAIDGGDVIEVVLNGETLKFGVDYVIRFFNNTNVGTAIATIVAASGSNYTGYNDTGRFAIEAAVITSIDPIAPQAFTGSAVEPTVVVKGADGAIIDPSEYDVTYENNINAGTNTATVTVKPTEGNQNVKGSATANFTITASVARVGNTYYGTLQSAIDAAQPRDTVVLLASVTENVTVAADKNITLDLNGNTVSSSIESGNWGAAFTNEGNLTITDNSDAADGAIVLTQGGSATNSVAIDNYGTLAIVGGSVRASNAAGVEADNFAIYNNGGSKLAMSGGSLSGAYGVFNDNAEVTLSDGTITAGYGISSKGNGTAGSAKVTVSGGTIVATNFAISTNGSTGMGGSVIDIAGGSITSSGDACIYLPNADVTTISGGTVTGATAVYQKSGTLTIAGGELHATGAKADFVHNGNGVNATGDALLVETCDYPGGAPTTVISGGTFRSDNASAVASYATEGYNALTGFIAPDATAAFSDANDSTKAAVPAGKTLVQGEDGLWRLADQTFTVTFVSDGSTVEEKTVVTGNTVDELEISKDGFSFLGWFAEGSETSFDFTTPITASITLTAKWGDDVASITTDGNTVIYSSLADAIDAAQSGDTVVLLKDTVLTEGIEVDKAVKLDLNGKTVTYATTASKADYVALFTVSSDGDLTITGNGTINGPENGAALDGKALIDVDGGKLAIENGTLTATGEGSDGMYGVYVLNSGTATFGTPDGNGPAITSHFAAIGTNNTTAPANITINGGTYTAEATPANNEWWSYFCAPVYAAAAGSFDLQGGTFNGYYGISDRYANVDQTVKLGNVTINASSGTDVFVDSQTGSEGATNRTIFSTVNTRTLPEGYQWLAVEGGFEVGKGIAQIGETIYGSLAAAVAAAENGDTIVLLDNTTVESIEIDKQITIDLNGKTVSSGSPALFEVTGNGDLTITGNGTVNGPANGAAFDGKALIDVDGGKLAIENGTLTATGEGSDGMYGVYVSKGGTATFGTPDGNGPAITSHFAAIGANNTTAPVTITVNGGTYTAEANPANNEWWSYFCAPVYAPGDGTYTINGGTFNGFYGISTRYANVDQNITLGNATLNASSGIQVFIDEASGSGGSGVADRHVNSTSNALTLPEGWAWLSNGDGTFTAVKLIKVDKPEATSFAFDNTEKTGVPEGEGYTLDGIAKATESGSYNVTATLEPGYIWSDGTSEPVQLTWTIGAATAKIGDTYYPTLQAAIDAAQDGDTITMVADEDLAAQVVVGKEVTLDLDGHKLYNTADIWNAGTDAWSLISVQEGGDLTVTGNGSIIAKDNDCYAADVRDGGKLTIEDGAYVGNITAVYALEGSVTVNGGDFSAVQKSDYNDYRYLFNCYDSSYTGGTATITINGGTFHGFDPSDNLAEGPATDFTPIDKVGKETAEGVWTVVDATAVDKPVAQSFTYNGTAQTGVAAGEGYALDGTASATNVGNYTVTATLEHGYYWSDRTVAPVELSWSIAAADITNADVDTVLTVTYTGSELTPDPVVKLNGSTLVKGTDYTVAYDENNINVGTATITVTGIGNYTGTATTSFAIVPNDANITVAAVPDQAFTGKAITPALTVADSENNALVAGTDYTVEYRNNVDPGAATFVVQLTGNHSGSYVGTFNILAPVAKVGDTYFQTLQSAIDAAQPRDTVVLLADVSVERTTISKDLVLDLGGKTVTGRVTIDDGDVTVENGTVAGRLDAYDSSVVTLAADATVNGQAIVWGDGALGQDGCKTPVLNVYGTIANAGDSAISTNGTDRSGAQINVFDGARVTSADEIAIYLPSGSLAISGGTVTGATAVYQKSGALSIAGGELHATGEAKPYTFNGNGAYATGDALVVESCGYPNGAPSATITGGTFASDNASAIGSYATEGNDALTGFIAQNATAAFSDASDSTKAAVPAGKTLVQGEDGLWRLADEYVVTFQPNIEGIEPNEVKVASGQTVAKPADPTRDDAIFAGWQLNGADYDFDTPVTGSITLEATWTAAVAKVGDTLYATFAEAAEAANGTETITLLAKITEPYTLEVGETLIVARNGKSLTVKAPEGPYVYKSSTVNGVTTYTVAEADVEFTNANGVVSYKAFSSTVIGANGTYKLLKDVTTNLRLAPGIAASNVTLDLNGHTITSNATDCAILLSRAGSASAHKTFSIVDMSEDGGGAIIATGLNANESSDALISVTGKYNDVTIGEGVTVSGGCVALTGQNQTLNVNGAINGGEDFAIATNGSTTKDVTININDGASVTSSISAIYLPGTGTTTISGGTVTGTTAVYQKSGTLNITGGELVGTGEAKPYTFNGNGAYATGDALVVDNCGYPGGAPVISITGGTLRSTNASAIGSYAYGDGNQALKGFIDPDATAAFGDDSENTYAGVPEGKYLKKGEDGLYRLADIVKIDVPAAETGLVYNGEKQTGVLEGEGYTLTDNTGTNAGGYTATATLADPVATTWADGTTENKTIKWSIAKANLADVATVGTIETQTYTGSAIEPAVTVSVSEPMAISASDYAVAITNNVNPGNATITVTADENSTNYTGSVTSSFVIADGELAELDIDAIADQTFTGSAIEPAITIDGVAIDAETYIVAYANNINAGTATVTITAKDPNVKGSTGTTFQIKRADLANVSVDAIADKAYTGAAQTPAPTVKLGEYAMTADTDYVVTYIDNTDVGTASVVLSGKGNFEGTKTVTFKITELDKTALEQAIAAAQADEAATPVSEDGKDVKPDTEYVTPATKAALDEAIADAQAVLDNPNVTAAQIAEAVEAMNAAKTAFDDAKKTATVDKSALSSAITAAQTDEAATSVSEDGKDVKPGTDYVDQAAKDALDEAIADAQAVLNDADATQDEVDAAVEAMKDAKDAFDDAKKKAAVDKTALEQAIAAATADKTATPVSADGKDQPAGTEYVDQATQDTLTAAIATAQAVAGKADATQAEVDAATTAMNAAKEAFDDAKQTASVNTKPLSDAIAAAQADEAATTISDDGSDVPDGEKFAKPVAKGILDDAIAAAQAVLGNPNATQNDIDAAAAAMNAAKTEFDRSKETAAVDKSALNASINAAAADKEGTKVSEDGSNVPNGSDYVPQAAADALAEAIEAAQAVSDKQGATQAEVEKAKADLDAAKKAFDDAKKKAAVDKSDLEQAIAAATADNNGTTVSADGKDLPDGTDYVVSQDIKDALAAAIADAQAVANKENATQAEVDKAKADLEEAQAAFDEAKKKSNVDRSALSDKVSAALDDVKNTEVSKDGTDLTNGTEYVEPETQKALVDAVGKAAAKLIDPNATQAQIDAATAELAAAKKAFDDAKKTAAVDKSALSSAINAAKTDENGTAVSSNGKDLPNGTKYVTSATKKALDDAIAAAQAVLNDADATQAEVDDATAAMNAAKTAFDNAKKTASVNTKPLSDAIKAAQTDENGTAVSSNGKDLAKGTKYVTSATKKALDDAITAAQKVLNDPKSTQNDIDAATTAMNNAKTAFDNAKKTASVNTKPLSDAIKAAKADRDATTVASKASDVPKGEKFVTKAVKDALDKAIAAAEKVLSDPKSSQNDIDAATAALKAAQKKFDDAKKTGTKVAKIDISKARVSVSNKVYDGVTPYQVVNGSITNTVKVTMPDGTVLKEGVDYEFVTSDHSRWQVSDNEWPGTVTVTVRGIGNYTGTAKGTCRISEPFVDVNPSTYHYHDVLWMSATGISRGWGSYPNCEYRPMSDIVRCDMAAFLYRLAGEPAYTPSAAELRHFTDVNTSTPHYREILWMYHAGITTGYQEADGTYTFRPMELVYRCDMAAFLHRLAGNPPASSRSSFNDVNSGTAHYADIMWLASTGVSTGFDDGGFHPYDTIKRCDMAAFLHRMYDYELVPTNVPPRD